METDGKLTLMEKFDIVVIGGGVIGVSIAYHLARFGCRRVLLLERGQLGGGTTAQSSCILRTHYSVPENVALAKAAIAIFNDFPAYLDDAEAESGYNRCGMMLVAGAGRAPSRCGKRSPSSAAWASTRARFPSPTRSASTRWCSSTTSRRSAGNPKQATRTPT